MLQQRSLHNYIFDFARACTVLSKLQCWAGGVERTGLFYFFFIFFKFYFFLLCTKPKGKLHEDDADDAEEEAQLFGA